MLQDLNLDRHVKNITEKKFTEIAIDVHIKDIVKNIFSNIDKLFLGEKKIIKEKNIEYETKGKKWKANKSINQYPDFTVYEILHLKKDHLLIQQFCVKNLCTYEIFYSMPIDDDMAIVLELYHKYNNIVYDILVAFLNKYHIKTSIRHAFYPVKYYPWPYHWAQTPIERSPINRMGIHADKSILSSVVTSAPGLILNSNTSYPTYDKGRQNSILVWGGTDIPDASPCLHHVDFIKHVKFRYSLVNFLQYD